MILGLIMAVIFVTIGINMLPAMNTTVAAITTPTYSVGVVGLTGVTLIVYAAMIVFGILKSMQGTA
jgi:multisubunit Na+/H+ antiporter MnhF subunit